MASLNLNKFLKNKNTVTILGVLSGLGFTKFEGVQAKAKENADYIAASNLATAANLYLNDNYEPDGELK